MYVWSVYGIILLTWLVSYLKLKKENLRELPTYFWDLLQPNASHPSSLHCMGPGDCPASRPLAPLFTGPREQANPSVNCFRTYAF